VPFRVVAIILALSACALSVAWSDPPESPQRPLERAQGAAVPILVPGPGHTPDSLAAVESARDVWYASVQAEIDAYLIGLEQARQAAAARPVTRTPVGTTVGACTGFAIPDYIIQRESGGNPSAYNPSGAYGCAQTLLSHYSGGTCAGLDPYSIDGQRECVYRLSSGGTNLAPWAATR